jgi:hypothetical protein
MRLKTRWFDILDLYPTYALRGKGCTLVSARGGDANGKTQRRL